MTGSTVRICAIAWMCLWSFTEVPGQAPDASSTDRDLPLFGVADASGQMRLHRAALHDLPEQGRFRIRNLQTPDGRIDLALEQLRVFGPHTRFVAGSERRPLPPPDMTFLRGTIIGQPDSHVFLAIGRRVYGRIERPGQPTTLVGARPNTPDIVQLWHVHRTLADAPPIPPCGLQLGGERSWRLPEEPIRRVAGTVPQPGLRTIELAIETDFEFFDLFGDLSAAGDYVALLFAAISDVYVRDVNARLELSFVQLYDDEADELPYHDVDDPLGGFMDYWNANNGAIPRDVAKFLTGRRNLPYGGVAFLGTVCSSLGYSVSGYVLGELPDPTQPSNRLWDLVVAAHELGHNCGTPHTHDLGIDSCAFGDLQRGTIMSYCHTQPGGNANIDPRFHSGVQLQIESFLDGISCLTEDCNANGSDDAGDIQLGGSLDTNGNQVPDECEDCDGDGILNDSEISQGSLDLNGNAIPDECEADCNNNGSPDDRDILLGLSLDLYGDGVPDECETDCNDNGTSDYVELQADMSLDIDRNVLLDACEDCDNDGTIDLEALGGAHNLWASTSSGVVAQFHATSGVMVSTNTPVGGAIGDLRIMPSGDILVIDSSAHAVLRLDAEGQNPQTFVAGGSGGLFQPQALLFTPGGTLLVSSFGTDNILEYDGGSGAFIGVFVAAGAGGLDGPTGMTFGPGGDLFVSSFNTSAVLRYDGVSGAPQGTFVGSGSGGLSAPRGLLFKGDGNLIVASSASDEVLEYNVLNGAAVGRFDKGGLTTGFWALIEPWFLRIGPNGNLYVSSHQGNAAIHTYQGHTGAFMRSYYILSNPNLLSPAGFDFVPGFSVDCNLNGRPDSCDVSAGLQDECLAALCKTTADCADTDGDGIRDDACVFWNCAEGTCVGTDIDYADMGGEFGACLVDGTTDGNDRFHALNCFSDQSTLGLPGYDCEANPPSASNVDAAGLNQPCSPDGVCDGNDAFAALNAFDGSSTCACDGSPTPHEDLRQHRRSEQAALRLSSRNPDAHPGQLLRVDVHVHGSLDDLRGYQLHAAARGGRSGRLTLVDLAIDDRKDHAFAGLADWRAFNRQTQQMLAGLDGPGIAVRPGAYLASLTFRASEDAAGVFTVELLADPDDPTHRTALFATPFGQNIDITGVRSARIAITPR